MYLLRRHSGNHRLCLPAAPNALPGSRRNPGETYNRLSAFIIISLTQDDTAASRGIGNADPEKRQARIGRLRQSLARAQPRTAPGPGRGSGQEPRSYLPGGDRSGSEQPVFKQRDLSPAFRYVIEGLGPGYRIQSCEDAPKRSRAEAHGLAMDLWGERDLRRGLFQ